MSEPLWIAVPITGESPSLIVQPAGDPPGTLLNVGFFTIHRNARRGRTVPVQHTSSPSLRTAKLRLQSRAVELDPGLARAWAALGMAYSVEALNAYSSDPVESRERWNTCLEKALALVPADSTALISLGELRALQGDLKGCEQENAQALAMAPNDADSLAKLAGSLALVTGDPLQGYELAKRAIRLNPHTAWYHTMLGRCSLRRWSVPRMCNVVWANPTRRTCHAFVPSHGARNAG